MSGFLVSDQFQRVAQAIASNLNDVFSFYTLDTDYSTFATVRRHAATGPEVLASSTFRTSGWAFHDAAFFPATNELVVVAAGTPGTFGDNSGFYSVLSFSAGDLTLQTVNAFVY